MNLFGDPRLPRSFWDVRYIDDAGCWLRKDGGGTPSTIYRLAYEILIGPIPTGRLLHHACFKTEQCANPEHLEPVTRAVNSGYGNGHPRTGRRLNRDNRNQRQVVNLTAQEKDLLKQASERSGMSIAAILAIGGLKEAVGLIRQAAA